MELDDFEDMLRFHLEQATSPQHIYPFTEIIVPERNLVDDVLNS